MPSTHHHEHHGHAHHHHHHSGEKSLALAFILNFSFALVEIVGGLLTNSMSILADALHDLGDSIALFLAWRLEKLSHRRPDQNYTYGYRRYSVLGALSTVVVLLIGSVLLISNAAQRLLHPQPVVAPGMIALAVLGLAVNGFAAWRVSRHSSHSHRAATLHLLEDVLGWALVLVGSVIIHFTGLYWIDSAMAFVINAIILFQVFKLVRGLLPILMQSTPPGVDLTTLKAEIQRLPLVADAHSLQAWTLDGEHHVISLHLKLKQTELKDLIEVKRQTKDLLLKHNFMDSTIEIELESEDCLSGARTSSPRHQEST